MSYRDDLALRDYLEHIKQAIGRIHRYLQDIDHAGFLVNEEKQPLRLGCVLERLQPRKQGGRYAEQCICE